MAMETGDADLRLRLRLVVPWKYFFFRQFLNLG